MNHLSRNIRENNNKKKDTGPNHMINEFSTPAPYSILTQRDFWQIVKKQNYFEIKKMCTSDSLIHQLKGVAHRRAVFRSAKMKRKYRKGLNN